MARVEIEGLRKTFGPTVAVERFDLAVADGEFIALLGPSGCGKTTVMRMVAGIAMPDAGTITVGGRSLAGVPPEKRNIGLFFQSYALFPHMTVAANVGFGLRMRGVPRVEAERRIGAMLDLVELGALGVRYPRELSGGQQQRVALARALVIEPDVLLLDEPLSNLDAKLRDQLREEIRALVRRLNITAIHVTHDQSEALALADRIIVMSEGRIVEQGAPRELYRAPRTRFVANFLGQTNLIPARAEADALVLPWGAKVADQVRASGALTLCVRPEDLRVSADPNGVGTVEEAVFHGADVEYRVRVGELALRGRANGIAAPLLAPGTTVAIGLPAAPHVLAEGAL